ncbi:MFS transporter [Streptomyces sp. NPDC127020]|uniref:MFS transporter n=1 Tax=Streptomyces sp. NPDC127020 TaxID=3347109 RepID=UPI00364C289F
MMAVLMLNDLGLAPWQYGLALGLPCLGGGLGSRLTPLLTRRFGQRRILLVSGVARTLWTILLALTPSGALGLFIIVAADFGLLFFAGVFNPSFTTYRMAATSDAFMSRVATSWSVGAKTCQAAFVITGGFIAATADVRGALLVAGLLCMASALLLPWRKAHLSSGRVPSPTTEAVPSPATDTARPRRASRTTRSRTCPLGRVSVPLTRYAANARLPAAVPWPLGRRWTRDLRRCGQSRFPRNPVESQHPEVVGSCSMLRSHDPAQREAQRPNRRRGARVSSSDGGYRGGWLWGAF